MQYTGPAVLTALGKCFPVDTRIDGEPGSIAWNGTISADLDWENLFPHDEVTLELPPVEAGHEPIVISLVFDLIVGDQVAVHGTSSALLHLGSPALPASA
jgi:hypothetical protein